MKMRFLEVLISYLLIVKVNGLSRTDIHSVEKMITTEGYPCETHQVITEDGYILTLHRIPYHSRNGSRRKGPVLLEHGLFCSSADFVVIGSGRSLSFLLSDEGYDVWLGNARGNKFSRKHKTLDPDEDKDEFWNFSFHEIGVYDLPATIDYILEVTCYESLSYVGHSQGTTVFFVMAAEKPEYNKKIRSMHAIGPAAYLSNMRSPLIILLTETLLMRNILLGGESSREFFPSTKLMALLGQAACHKAAVTQEICSNILFLAAGYDSEKLNRTALPAILQNTPAGVSTKLIVHFAQNRKSGKFRMFNHGWSKNKMIYGKETPPEYDLHKITCPVAMYYSENDLVNTYEDTERLAPQLPNLIEMYLVPFAKWNHLDFLYGIGVEDLVYAKVIEILNSYTDC